MHDNVDRFDSVASGVMIRFTLFSMVGLMAVAATAAPLFPSPDDWRDETVYQIITDRWFDGDPSNNTANPDGTYNPSGTWDIHGGDFAGLREKLYYLQGLGVTAVWISPIPRNVNGAFHGYGAQDFTTVDPHWGAQAELEAFIQEAHAVGIRVILDVVTNHGGDLIGSYDSGWSSYRPAGDYNLTWWGSRRHAAPFDDLSYFHAHGAIDSWVDPNQILGELSGLDDLRTEDAYVRSAMVTIWSDWVTNLDADGFRIDTVKHVDLGFWQTWAPQVRANVAAAGKTNFFMFGEVFDGSEYKVGLYTGTQAGGAFALDSSLDYPLHFNTNSVFAAASTGASNIEGHYSAIPSNYDPAAQDRLVTFLDNHDNPRFLSGSRAGGDVARLEVALTFLLTSRGVPTIYYGTEQGFDGETDPWDREDMFDGQFEQGPSLGDNFDQTASLYRMTRRLNQLRRDHLPLRRGTQTAYEVHSAPDIYAYSRIASGEEVLVILNSDPVWWHQSDPWTTTFAQGTVLVDQLDPSFTITVGSGGVIGVMPIDALAHHVMVPLSAQTNIEPDVIAVAPSHDQDTVAVGSAITVTFSEPMNQSTVEAAFSTTPARTGTFSWDASGEVVTFTPSSDWPGFWQIEVLIADSAEDLGGATLRGGFRTLFHTAAGPPPDPPSPVGPLPIHSGPIVVDADDSDWTGTPGAADTAVIDVAAGEVIWTDSLGDDLGDGDYTYPTNGVFTGGDADIAEVRVAVWGDSVYFLIRPASIDPGAAFFTPYFGIAVDTDQIDGSGRTDLGIELGLANGGADAVLSSKLAWEVQAALPGQNPLRVIDTADQSLSGATAAFSQTTGVVEIALPFSALGHPAGQTWDFVVYSALETLDEIREVRQSNSTWNPGGGFDDDTSGNDPDIFDLIGSAAATQQGELAGYSGSLPAVIGGSALVIEFGDAVPVDLSVFTVN